MERSVFNVPPPRTPSALFAWVWHISAGERYCKNIKGSVFWRLAFWLELASRSQSTQASQCEQFHWAWNLLKPHNHWKAVMDDCVAPFTVEGWQACGTFRFIGGLCFWFHQVPPKSKALDHSTSPRRRISVLNWSDFTACLTETARNRAMQSTVTGLSAPLAIRSSLLCSPSALPEAW